MKENYENYIPGHLDAPRYIGKWEFSLFLTVVLTAFFSILFYLQGSRLTPMALMGALGLYLKYRSQLGNYFDGFLYWHLGFSKVPMKKVKDFGVVPTYIKDFEE